MLLFNAVEIICKFETNIINKFKFENNASYSDFRFESGNRFLKVELKKEILI